MGRAEHGEGSPMRLGAKVAAVVRKAAAVGVVMEGLDGRVLLSGSPVAAAGVTDGARGPGIFASAADAVATTSHLTILNVGGYPASLQANSALRGSFTAQNGGTTGVSIPFSVKLRPVGG